MSGFDWAWSYIAGHPWIFTAIVPCSWVAHVGTNWIKGYRKEVTGSRPGKYSLRAYSFLLSFSLSSTALAYSEHIASADRAIFLGLVIAGCHVFLVALAFKVAEKFFPTVASAMGGYVYDDDPTDMKTFVAALAGTKVKPDRRSRDVAVPESLDRRAE